MIRNSRELKPSDIDALLANRLITMQDYLPENNDEEWYKSINISYKIIDYKYPRDIKQFRKKLENVLDNKIFRCFISINLSGYEINQDTTPILDIEIIAQNFKLFDSTINKIINIVDSEVDLLSEEFNINLEKNEVIKDYKKPILFRP